MSRGDHEFEFTANEIAAAAAELAVYHDDRQREWGELREHALDRVKETASVKVVEQAVTNGPANVSLAVDYGDQEAWQRFALADSKVKKHIQLRDGYLVDQRVYQTQGERPYRLSITDVAYFKLGGEARED
jgi:hypothetical protein